MNLIVKHFMKLSKNSVSFIVCYNESASNVLCTVNIPQAVFSAPISCHDDGGDI
jgi:hypothetical protein